MTKSKKILKPGSIFIIILVAVTHFLHNYSISELTRTRNTVYKSWSVLITDAKVFGDVSDGDSIISSTSNDAFEENAGFIYSKSKLRLTYLFNSGILWPNINKCTSTTCKLLPPSIAIQNTLINVTRDINDEKEWINLSRKLHQKDKYKVWFSNFIDFGNGTFVLFLVPFDAPKMNGLVRFNYMRVFAIAENLPVANPQIAGVCFKNKTKVLSKNKLNVFAYKAESKSNLVDFRELQVSGC